MGNDHLCFQTFKTVQTPLIGPCWRPWKCAFTKTLQTERRLDKWKPFSRTSCENWIPVVSRRGARARGSWDVSPILCAVLFSYLAHLELVLSFLHECPFCALAFSSWIIAGRFVNNRGDIQNKHYTLHQSSIETTLVALIFIRRAIFCMYRQLLLWKASTVQC